jgi:hypothetical protein
VIVEVDIGEVVGPADDVGVQDGGNWGEGTLVASWVGVPEQAVSSVRRPNRTARVNQIGDLGFIFAKLVDSLNEPAFFQLEVNRSDPACVLLGTFLSV